MPRAVDLLPIVGTVLFLAGTGGLFLWDTQVGRETRRAAEFRLNVMEQGGRIRIDWDPSSPAVLSGKSATLFTRDGDATHEYPVSGDALRGGGLDYLRRSNDVLLTLRILPGGAEASVRAVIAPVPPAQPQTTSETPGTVTRSRQ
jgi:hypothetical protein